MVWQGIVIGLLFFLLGFGLFFFGLYITGTIGIIFGPIAVVLFALMKRLTPEGADHFTKWRAFKRFLKHFSSLDRSTVPALAVWEHYLVYAVVLGVAKEVMEQLQLIYTELGTEMQRVWPAYGVIASNPVRFNSMSSAMERSFKTAFHSATSSGSGGGGGFSGGGGGGGGGAR